MILVRVIQQGEFVVRLLDLLRGGVDLQNVVEGVWGEAALIVIYHRPMPYRFHAFTRLRGIRLSRR